MKKKYKKMKPDEHAYEELVSDYERSEMPDYSFKSNSQAMGKNAKKLKRNKIIKIVLYVLGAIVVLYFGYFVVEVTKQVNSRPQTTTQEYVVIDSSEQSTTVPSTDESTTNESTTDNSSQADGDYSSITEAQD